MTLPTGPSHDTDACFSVHAPETFLLPDQTPSPNIATTDEEDARALTVAETEAFSHPPWRHPHASDPNIATSQQSYPHTGYLYGWGSEQMAYRLGWTEADKEAWNAGQPEKGNDGGIGAQRVGGALGRMGVKAVAASGHTLAVTHDGR